MKVEGQIQRGDLVLYRFNIVNIRIQLIFNFKFIKSVIISIYFY